MKTFSLVELEELKLIELGRGKVISKKDLNANPGNYPVYSSAKTGGGIFGTWGNYDFNEEMITWSVDGGGDLFHRNKHKFSITNVGGFIKVLDKNRINTKYLYYVLKNLHNGINFDWVKKAHPSVLRKEYNYIPVPTLQEQENIVERLDKVFENIDTNQEKILNLKFLYSQMKDSFINKNFSKEKTQDLSNFSDIQYGFTPDKNSREKIQVPILRITDIQNNKVDWENVPNVKVSQETFNKFCLKKGDILFARTGGTLGKSYLFNENKKAIFASYLIRVTNTTSDFNPKFLKYFFESTEYWKQVNQGTIGAAQPFFNGKKLGNLKIPYFSKDDQKLIIKKLDKVTDLIEKLNDLNMLKKNKYSYFQKSILHKEFSYE